MASAVGSQPFTALDLRPDAPSRPQIDTEIAQEIGERIREELDYALGGATCGSQDDPEAGSGVHIPEPVDAFEWAALVDDLARGRPLLSYKGARAGRMQPDLGGDVPGVVASVLRFQG